jgi:hypothetical protein
MKLQGTLLSMTGASEIGEKQILRFAKDDKGWCAG